MNYEANPFQDYESITIDELEDQATLKYTNSKTQTLDDLRFRGKDEIK